MKRVLRIAVNAFVRFLTHLFFKVDAESLQRIPLEGPIIIIVNHVNFLELPMIYPRIRSHLGIGYSKVENWDNPIYRLLFNLWDLIPIDRDDIDITALRRGLRALDERRILFITPEGTRSHDGRLQRGKPGAAWIALHSGVPVWPVACYGGESFADDLRNLRRPEYHIRVGEPFRVTAGDRRVTSAVRQEVVDEMMGQIASLLPPRYRGVYEDRSDAPARYLRFTQTETNDPERAYCRERKTDKRKESYA